MKEKLQLAGLFLVIVTKPRSLRRRLGWRPEDSKRGSSSPAAGNLAWNLCVGVESLRKWVTSSQRVLSLVVTALWAARKAKNVLNEQASFHFTSKIDIKQNA